MGIYGTLGHSETHFRGENSAFLSAVFTAFELGGFRPLAHRKSGQPPLFSLFLYYILIIEGPWGNSFAGIVFWIYGLGIKPASTCCALKGSDFQFQYQFRKIQKKTKRSEGVPTPVYF